MTKARNLADVGSNDVLDTSSTGVDVTGTVTADGLTVDGSAYTSVIADGTSGGSFKFYKNSSQHAQIFSDGSGDLIFRNNSDTERLRINSSGNVGIGTSSPDEKLEVQTGNIKLGATANTTSKLIYERSGATRAETYVNSSNAYQIDVAGSERARIDSSGNLLVGKTSTAAALTTAGSFLEADGQIWSTKDGGPSLMLSRKTSDGSIIDLHKDGTTVGSIGSDSGDLFTGTGDTGFRFLDGSDAIAPYNTSTKAVRNGAINLGYSSGRFKDLYLSGGTKLYDTEGEQGRLNVSGNSTFLMSATDLQFRTGGFNSSDEAMRIDSSGNLLVGKTSNNIGADGLQFIAGAGLGVTRDGSHPLALNRKTSDGDIVQFRKDGSTVGSIGVRGGTDPFFVSHEGSGTGIKCNGGSNALSPCSTNGSNRDNVVDLGESGNRYDDIYATNGTIQTSDRNEKQDIASLTGAEMNVAKRISAMFKKFRWIDSVEAKGDDARIHNGVIAQDVQQAFTDEGLDAGDYALFISTTWHVDADGNEVEADAEGAVEKTRMGIRYPQLLSFLAAYNEQRFSAIEARLDALEGN